MVEWQRPPALREIDVPSPGPGQVLVRIAAAGACHSDLHVMEWPAGTLAWKLPFTLGHENAGWVEALGAGVTGLAKGDAVAVYGPWGCGRCRACHLGRENVCENAGTIPGAGGGLGYDGGMADFMIVPSARFLVPLGKLDPVQAAPLGDAALTPYHAIKRGLALLEPGATAVVIGLGGLGHMAVQLLRASSPAQIVALDIDEDKLALAREAGADEALLSDDRAAGRIKDISRAGAALVLDCVGADATLALGARVLRKEGRLSILGLAGGKLPVDWFSLPYGASVETSYWGTIVELGEILALAAAGKVRVRVETHRLDDVAKVYDRLRAGKVRGRAVVTP